MNVDRNVCRDCGWRDEENRCKNTTAVAVFGRAGTLVVNPNDMRCSEFAEVEREVEVGCIVV